MEGGGGGGKLKQRLARMFRSPSLLRSSCHPSISSGVNNLSSTASSKALLRDAVHEPVFVSSCHHENQAVLDDSIVRALSLPIPNDHHQLVTAVTPVRRSVDCNNCRPRQLEFSQPSLRTKNERRKYLKTKKKERRVRRETGRYVGTGAAEVRGTYPPASPSTHSTGFYCYHYLNRAKEVEMEEEDIKKKTKKKLLSNAYGFTSSSSMECDAEFGLFSSDDEKLKEETETFFSSKSFSSDSSEFYQRPKANAFRKKSTTRYPQRRRAKSYDSWGLCKGFQPLVSVNCSKTCKKESGATAKEEKRGFAVVKRSSDPYSDFRSSMVEMIIQRQIFGAEDLECLLQSYLSLNSPRHHPVILQALSDIWVVLFGH